MDMLGDPNSKTSAFIRQYTKEVVTRYINSPAIWGWEMGNEYNLFVDLPNAAEQRPPVVPSLKTALKRTERDDLSSKHMLTAFDQFAKTVRNYDKTRIIITGNAVPRASAYHNTTEKSWTPDSLKQFGQILLRDNPDPYDTICVHIYPEENNNYPSGAKNLDSLIKNIQKFSLKVKKPLFIGEFGAPRSMGKDKERHCFEELLRAIEINNVPLAAFWVFDFKQQDNDWNVTFTNDRAYMIELVRQANIRIGRHSN
jgi:endo-1,4-beta-mannosidase